MNPLYHFSSASRNDHVYKQDAVPPTGYATEPIAAVGIEPTGPPELALYKFKRATSKPFTTYGLASEKAALVAQGYSQVATPVGYLLPAGTPGTLPTYRLQSPAGDVILTGDYVERDTKVADGWMLTATLPNLTHRLVVPYDRVNNTPPYAIDGKIAADPDVPEPFKVFRAIEAVTPPEIDRGIQLVTAPRYNSARKGTYAWRHKIAYGDSVGGLKGQRSLWKIASSQMYGSDAASIEGLDRWFGFAFLMTDEYRVGPLEHIQAGNAIAEFHSGPQGVNPVTGVAYSPCMVPIAFFAKSRGDGSPAYLRFRVNGGVEVSGAGTGTGYGCTVYEHQETVDLGDVPDFLNEWHEVIWHVVFNHSDPNVAGLTEMWLDGAKVAEFHGPNMYHDKKVTWFEGNYRGLSWDQPCELILSPSRQGNTLEEVAP